MGILIGGAEDGFTFPIDGPPALSVGMISGTDPDDFFGCECYSCDEHAPDDEPEVWTCWMLSGLSRTSDGERCWGYVPVTGFEVTRDEQRLHDTAVLHDTCDLCRLEDELRNRYPSQA